MVDIEHELLNQTGVQQVSPLQRKATEEAKELVDDVIEIVQGFGADGSTKGLVSAGVKLAKASGWLETALKKTVKGKANGDDKDEE